MAAYASRNCFTLLYVRHMAACVKRGGGGGLCSAPSEKDTPLLYCHISYCHSYTNKSAFLDNEDLILDKDSQGQPYLIVLFLLPMERSRTFHHIYYIDCFVVVSQYHT